MKPYQLYNYDTKEFEGEVVFLDDEKARFLNSLFDEFDPREYIEVEE